MSSKKCDGILPNKKICGAEVFFNDAKGEQCPRECAHCGHVINAFYDETKEGIKAESFETKYTNLLEKYNELDQKYEALIAENSANKTAQVPKKDAK